jgi:hypothetical protein
MDGRFRWVEAEGEMIRLTLGRMFEATVRDCSYELVLEQEVAETGRVDAHIAALLICACVIGSKAALRRTRTTVGGRLGGLDLLVGVVDEILLVRHDEIRMGWMFVELLELMIERRSWVPAQKVTRLSFEARDSQAQGRRSV